MDARSSSRKTFLGPRRGHAALASTERVTSPRPIATASSSNGYSTQVSGSVRPLTLSTFLRNSEAEDVSHANVRAAVIRCLNVPD